MARGVCGYPDEPCPRRACDSDFEGCAPGLVHKQGRDKRFLLKMKTDVKLTSLFWFISVILVWTYTHWKSGGHCHDCFVRKSVSQVIFVRSFHFFFPILTIHVDLVFFLEFAQSFTGGLRRRCSLHWDWKCTSETSGNGIKWELLRSCLSQISL